MKRSPSGPIFEGREPGRPADRTSCEGQVCHRRDPDRRPACDAGGRGGEGGGPADRLAAQECKQQRKQLGRNAFRKRYGARNAMRSCIKRNRGRVRTANRTAADACRAELAVIGLEQFIEDYGSDETGYDAMSECIADALDLILDPAGYDEDPELDDGV